MTKRLAGLCPLLLALSVVACEPAGFSLDARSADDLAKAMPPLAIELIRDYEGPDRETHLDNLFRMQLVAGRFEEAIATLGHLRELRETAGDEKAGISNLQYVIYARARLMASAKDLAFEEAFGQAFREAFEELDDLQAYRVAERLVYRLDIARAQIEGFLEERSGSDRLDPDEALRLVRMYLPYHVYAGILPLVPDLLAEDEAGRYEITDDVLIETDTSVTLSAVVVRPRRFDTPQPAAFAFNIYSELSANRQFARLAAAHGYVGVVADARGKRLSPDAIEPYEHEAADTHAVLDWIAKQPWSDGRVAMFGGSYLGFAAWAAAKSPHPALKAIAASAAAIPGLGLPMHNNVFLNANYCWTFHVTNNKTLDHEVCRDRERWERMEEQWYASGRPYRELDDIDGTPNPLLQRWLDHPAYDGYWQRMVPFGEEFAKIDIPVLTITGYFDDGQVSALHYLNEHYRHHPDPEHYLLIGPYDHRGAQWAPAPVVAGYEIDPVARISPPEITFQWFDHVLRNGPEPALLEDRINYQVMGADEWRHAPAMSELGDSSLRLYLSDAVAGDSRMLSATKPTRKGVSRQVVDFSDRDTTSFGYYPAPIIRSELDAGDALVFVSEPFDEPVEVAGAFSGNLVVTINKKDMDVVVALYERMPDGRYFHLSYYLGRASFAEDMTRRELLEPGSMASLPIRRSYMTARRLQAGSRLVAVVDVNRGPWAQINYGTGGDVSDESIEDAEEPLVVQWHNESFLEIGVRR